MTEDSLLPKSRVCTKCGEEKLLGEFHKCKGGTYGRTSQCKLCRIRRKRSFSVDPNLKEKKCSKCGKTKSTNDFTLNKNNSTGLDSSCKLCLKQYRETNKEEKEKQITDRLKNLIDNGLLPKNKVCTKCGKEKLLEEFHAEKKKKDGRKSSCKECEKEHSKQYLAKRKAAKEKEAEHLMDSLAVKSKVCTKCGEEKLLEEFHKQWTGQYGRASQCKVCILKQVKSLDNSPHPDLKEKTCSKCKEKKSVDEFSKNKRILDGLNSVCKDCTSKYYKSLNYSHDPDLKEKLCSKCKETKPVDEFNKNKRALNGFDSWCRECEKERRKLHNFSVDPNLKENTCTKCKKTKSVDEFRKDKRVSIGLKSWCKECEKELQRSCNYPIDQNLKEKTCTSCNQIKPVNYFNKTKGNSSGLASWCKDCQSKYASLRRKNCVIRYDLKEKLCNTCKETKSINEFFKNKGIADGFNASCKVCLNAQKRQKYHTDPLYKLKVAVRGQTYKIVKLAKLKKEKRSIEYLGCTIAEFKDHIESQFVEGMSWDNHSHDTWHIDHIIPISYFVKYSDNPFEANNYRNQRPMWGKENISKGDTLDMDLVKSYGIEDLLPEGVDK